MQYYVLTSKLPSWRAVGTHGLGSLMQHREGTDKTM